MKVLDNLFGKIERFIENPYMQLLYDSAVKRISEEKYKESYLTKIKIKKTA
jgi:hypothetical protein